jgi:hypothetical protein
MGCSHNQVTRPPENQPIDLSGLWNDVDARMISDEMSVKISDSKLILNLTNKYNKKPVIRFGKVIVRMDDGSIVNTDIFLNSMRNAIINTGKVTVKSDTLQTHRELEDQSNYAKNGKELGVEIAPDLLLTGKIHCQNDQNGRRSIKYIIADFELVDVQSGEIVWAERATPIKKDVSHASFKYKS